MANQLSALPWVVDTVSDDPIWTKKIRIDHIDYVGWTDANHQAEVTDENGNLVALLSGNTNFSTIRRIGWVNGLTVPTTLTDGGAPNMPSGKLIIYTE